MKIRLLLFGCLYFAATCSMMAQDAPPTDWHLKNPASSGYPGIDLEKTYTELLKGKQSQTVIVAVIDSGVDSEHEDLSGVMWINDDEKAGNGIDDDKNGYVDDIHGWNFIGGKDGDIHHDALEISRLVAKYNKKFKGKDPSSLSKKEKAEYAKYEEMKKEIASKKEKAQERSMGVSMIYNSIQTVKEKFGSEDVTIESLNAVKPGDEKVAQAVNVVKSVMQRSGMGFEELSEEVGGAFEYFDSQIKYYYNPDYDPRDIVGDDYSNQKERIYGNNRIKGPDANHGTHVAGIIAAMRSNDVGMDGIADNVKIMSVRCVPDGDERDKDVANAIRYAVDNGASIINMSFGKSYAWNKKVVDDAVRYAMKKDVLLVHAAGNDNKDNDTTNNFPNDKFAKKRWFSPKIAKNWIEVGAVNWKGGDELPASFSNYGQENVDVFAPGTAIYSTVVDNEYDSYPGTSMASPMVAGVAALIRSYYPTLSAVQVKNIIENSSDKIDRMVVKPGTDEKVKFSELSTSGGTLNAYKAVQMAAKTKGKKKIKKSKKKAVARP
ncbi:MAG: S8 family peptidase [Bacteroidota bacterium]